MRLNGSQIVGECLTKEDVEVVFGIPGGAILPLYDYINRYPFRHVLARHEQGAAHMADGYARASGKVGVCMGTSGPGATNLVTGILTAQMDSAPMVAITVNVASPFIGTDAFQEADISGITIPVTKQSYLVRHTRDLPRVMKEAFHIARTGRPGVVHVDIPKDILLGEIEFEYPETVNLPGYEPTYEGNVSQIRKAARLIEQAKRPVILAGHGVILSRAWDELKELAERTGAPVITTLLGISAFPESHPLSLGWLGMHGWVHANYAVHYSDLVVGIGNRFDDRACGKFSAFAPSAKIVHVDIDPAEIGKNVRTDVPIVGDVKRVLAKLTPEIGECVDKNEWYAVIGEWKKQFPPKRHPDDTREVHNQQIVEAIYRATGGQATIVTDVGQHQMWAAQYYTFDRPNAHITSGGLGTMGFSVPAAVGVQFARPNEEVWCMVGDGCFQMTNQELAVMVQERLPVKIALFNNQSLGMVRQWQDLFYDGRLAETEFVHSPDFVKLADAYGIPGSRVTSPREIERAVNEARAFPGPYLIEFGTSRTENCFPMVVPGTALIEVIPDETYTGGNHRGPAVHAQPGGQLVSATRVRN